MRKFWDWVMARLRSREGSTGWEPAEHPGQRQRWHDVTPRGGRV